MLLWVFLTFSFLDSVFLGFLNLVFALDFLVKGAGADFSKFRD